MKQLLVKVKSFVVTIFDSRPLYAGEKNIFLSLLYLLFLFSVIGRLNNQIYFHYPKDSWSITEWLINYQAGFIRRGLGGEIILKLYQYFGLSPYVVIMAICLIAYIAVILYFVYAFYRKKLSLFLLPFVFFLGGPILNYHWVRKDITLILLFILALHFIIKKGYFNLIVANVFLIISILLHESAGFLCFPILLLILIDKTREKGPVKSFFISVCKVLPSFLSFVMVLYNCGTLISSNKIWQSWQNVPFPYPSAYSTISGEMEALSWPLKKSLDLQRQTLSDFYSDIYAPLVWVLVILLIYYLLTNTDKLSSGRLKNEPINKLSFSAILLLQFIAVTPLFILGCDFGRWIFFWVTTSFATYTLIPKEKHIVLFPRFIINIALKFNLILEKIFPKSKGFVSLLPFLIGFPAFAIAGNNSISDFYNNSALSIGLRFLSYLIHGAFFRH